MTVVVASYHKGDAATDGALLLYDPRMTITDDDEP